MTFVLSIHKHLLSVQVLIHISTCSIFYSMMTDFISTCSAFHSMLKQYYCLAFEIHIKECKYLAFEIHIQGVFFNWCPPKSSKCQITE